MTRPWYVTISSLLYIIVFSIPEFWPHSSQLTKDTSFVYLPGEVKQEVKSDVTYICPYSGPNKGIFTITNYRLHFVPQPATERDIVNVMDVPLGVVRAHCILYNQTHGDMGEVATVM